MTAPAAIAAQLVDMRNVGTHKSLRLTIHIPEEQALQAIAAFGWPTGVAPVPIAIARLNPEKEVMPTEANSRAIQITDTPPRQEPSTPGGAKTKTAFRDMRLSNQAGILCNEGAFHRFLAEKLKYPQHAAMTDKAAADYVRRHCNVASRKDIRPRTPSGDRWQKLFDEYQVWMHASEYAA